MTKKNFDNYDVDSADPTEGYQFHDYPLWIKMMYLLLIAWGIAFSAYYILSGYDSEKDYDRNYSFLNEHQHNISA